MLPAVPAGPKQFLTLGWPYAREPGDVRFGVLPDRYLPSNTPPAPWEAADAPPRLIPFIEPRGMGWQPNTPAWHARIRLQKRQDAGERITDALIRQELSSLTST